MTSGFYGFYSRLTIAAVYGPNRDGPDFYKDLIHRIELIGNASLIMGGNWNVSQNYDLDTFNFQNENYKHAQKILHSSMMQFDLIDVWRELNPTTNRYT